jgi:menaquinone-dependent protoporphyrinogen oxidase
MSQNPSSKRITRRRFLIASGIVLGASCLTCTGLTFAARSAGQTVVVDTPSFTYGKDEPMNQRILVTYATRSGSSVGVASAIGEELAARGFAVDVKPAKENPSPAGYQSVIIGSAINGGRWLPEAVEYVQNNQQALNTLPVALFCVHIMNLGEDAASRKKRLAYLDSIRALVKTEDEAFFAGKGLDANTTPWFLRVLARTFGITAEGDCRDFAKIRAWGQTVF